MNRDRDRDLEIALPYDAPSPPPPTRYYPPSRREPDFDWRLIRGFLRGYKWTILGVFVTTVISGYATLSMLTDLYDVEGEILVKLGRETLDPPATSRNAPLSTGLRHEDLMSEVQIMRSPVLFRRIVDDLGPEAFKSHRVPPEGFISQVKFQAKSAARWAKRQWKETLIALDLQKRLSDRDAAVQELIDGLSVEPRKESDVLAIKMRIADPNLGVQIVQRLVDLYMERRLVVRRSDGVKEFLDAGAAKRKGELQHAEMQRLALKRSQGLVSATEQKALLLKQAEDVRADLIRTRSEIQNLGRQIASGREQMNATPQFERSTEQTTPNPLVEKLRQQVADLKSERATLLTKYQAESIPVKNLDERIRDLEAMLSREKVSQPGTVTSQLNPVRQNLEQRLKQDMVRLEGIKAAEKVQAENLDTVQAQVRRIDEADSAMVGIERQRQIAEQAYLAMVKRQADADVATELDKSRISNVSILTPPSPTLTPVYPRKLLIMGVLLPVGLLLGVGLSLLLHYAGGAVGDPREIEVALAIPCLGEVNLKPRLLN